MEERIKLVLSETDVERMDFSVDDVVTVNVHGLTRNAMVRSSVKSQEINHMF